MEGYYIRESLLRLSSSPLLSFLAPSLSSTWRSSLTTRMPRYVNTHTQRFLSASNRYRKEESTQTTRSHNANPKTKSTHAFSDLLNPTEDLQPPPAGSSNAAKKEDIKPKIDAKFDELFPPRTDPSSSPFQSPSASSEVADAFRAFQNTNRTALKPGSIASNMLMPGAGDGSKMSQRQMNAGILRDTIGVARRNKRTVRSRPSVGRTIEVDEKMGVDFGRAMMRLSTLLSTNKVKYEKMMQRYHERPGLKRKRLKRERWRRYFNEAFQAAVGRVKQMKRQGW